MRGPLALRPAALVLLAVCAAGAAADGSVQFEAERVGTLRDRVLREVSGMAASARDPGLLWVHNDSGSGAEFHAIALDGEVRARVRLGGATASDWEDMAAFSWQGEPMLVIADIGDNKAQRSSVWLHMVVEPDLAQVDHGASVDADIAWSVPFRYPDGPRDSEAVAVDPATGNVLLLSKRENPPKLYAVPIKPDGALPGRGRLHTARLLGPVNSIPRPTAADLMADPVYGAYSSQPTAMDLVDDELIVLTYKRAYLFRRDAHSDWAEALARTPASIEFPSLKQAEAMTFDSAGVDVFVTSERLRAPLYRLRRRPQSAQPPSAR